MDKVMNAKVSLSSVNPIDHFGCLGGSVMFLVSEGSQTLELGISQIANGPNSNIYWLSFGHVL